MSRSPALSPNPMPSLDGWELGDGCPPVILASAQAHNLDIARGLAEQSAGTNELRSAADPACRDYKPCKTKSLDVPMAAVRGQGSLAVPLRSPPSADSTLSGELASGHRRSYGCTQCEQLFSRQSALDGHLLTHGSGSQHYCDRCGAHFISLTQLVKHTATMHPSEKMNKGDQCQGIFINGKSLDFHAVSHNSKKLHACPKCGKRYNREICLQYHMRLCHDRKPHACDECGKTYSNVCKLRDHMRTHTGEKPYVCDECKKRFARKEYLHYHMQTHTGNRPYECDDCKKRFIRKTDLRRHMQAHTEQRPKPNDEWPYHCDACGGRFWTKTEVSRHMLSHTGEKPYVNEELRLLSCLKAHVMTTAADRKPGATCDEYGTPCPCKAFTRSGMQHGCERSHVCDDCGVTFTAWSKLREHVRVHSDERPYLCDECGAGFKTKGSRKVHVLTHSGEKPYACSMCEAGFVTMRRLKEHMVAHSVEKPHVCPECGKRYKRLNSLKIHVLTHTHQLPYACSQCPQRFSWKRSLGRHEKRTHGNENPCACDVCMEARRAWMLPTIVETQHACCEPKQVPKEEAAGLSHSN